MIHVYAASVGATNSMTGAGITKPACIRAKNESEAKDKGMALAFEAWPKQDRWIDHQAAIMQVPDKWLSKVPLLSFADEIDEVAHLALGNATFEQIVTDLRAITNRMRENVYGGSKP